MIPNTPLNRKKTHQVNVSWKEHVVCVGGGAPVMVQSMTNTDTADALNTALQVKALYLAGSEVVRITVNNEASAEAVPYIREQLDKMRIPVPLVGDFHYNGHCCCKSFRIAQSRCPSTVSTPVTWGRRAPAMTISPP